MCFLLAQRDHQVAVVRRDSCWVVPLEVVCSPVMQIDCFPVRIISWIEASARCIEFIGPDKLKVVGWVRPRGFRISLLGRIGVNDCKAADQVWDLTGRVCASDVKRSECGRLMPCEMCNYGVPSAVNSEESIDRSYELEEDDTGKGGLWRVRSTRVATNSMK